MHSSLAAGVMVLLGVVAPAATDYSVAPAAVPQAVGPVLKPGFPVEMLLEQGTYQCCSSAVLAGDVDGDPGLEVLASGQGAGSITAVDPDGSPLPGWEEGAKGHEYLSLAELDPARPGWEVVVNEFSERITAMDGAGRPLPGWPRTMFGNGLWPAVPVDRDRDGTDELVLPHDDGENWMLDAQGDSVHDGTWPLKVVGDQVAAMPAVADLDGDGRAEVLGGDSAPRDSGEKNLWARHGDGSPVAGWPVSVPDLDHLGRIVVGDVSGDSEPEVVVEGYARLAVYSRTGQLLADWKVPDSDTSGSMSHPALGDLDGDGDAEVVVVRSHAAHAFHGDGSALSGWPRALPALLPSIETASPVIGDLDNDGRQDVVAVGTNYVTTGLQVFGWSGSGVALEGFPLRLPVRDGWTPAIADIDDNGRSDLVVVGDEPSHVAGRYAGMFAYEYPTGQAAQPDWGQDAGGPGRRGEWRGGVRPVAEPVGQPGSAGPFTRVADLSSGPGGSAPSELTVLGDRLVFAATGDLGRELWSTDGTADGTHLLRDIHPGGASSGPDRLTVVGDDVYFTADDGIHGRELWVSDGTSGGTRLATDVLPGSDGSRPADLVALGDRVFFSARTPAGRELWVQHGETARLFWDGTIGDTAKPATDSRVQWVGSTGTHVAWLARASMGSVAVRLLGTDGTNPPQDLLPGWYAGTTSPSLVHGGVTSGGDGTLWFRLDHRLVRTDGTPAGTTTRDWYEHDDNAMGEPSPRGNDVLLAASNFSGRELYRGDGTEVLDIDPGRIFHGSGAERASGAPAHLRRWQDGWFMSARTLAGGREPWTSDGTAPGTRQLADLAPGAADSNPVPLVDLGDRMLVRATTPGQGDEPWVVTPSGDATRLADVAAGPRGSHAGEAVVPGDRVLLVLDNGASGRELWAVSVTDVPDPGATTPTPTPTPTPTASSTPTPVPTPIPAPSPTADPSVAPSTTVNRHPAARTTSRRASFRFRADQPDARFECRLDRGPWRACRSPRTIRGLTVGRHVLRVRATSATGLREATPAVVRWRVRPAGRG